ncbi:M6 metalloprotease [Thozetella sp. PMI_491]|nr:M6 metalloprotease [Thozetella sp. PMI_491]
MGQNCAPSTGTLSGFMFFIDFADQSAPASETPQSLYDFFLPSAAQWYSNSSFGKLHLNVTADTTKFYRMGQRASSYNWNRGLTSETHEKYILDALDAYLKGSGNKAIPPVDVLYVVPTRKASAISFSPTYLGPVSTRSGSHVSKSCVTFGTDAYEAWQYKVLNHETGHSMCLPDMYPENDRTGLWVGGWDMMGYINGPSPDYFAWDKWRLGWIVDEQVDCITGAGSSTHTLWPMEVQGREGETKAVVVKKNSTTVLVAEVRSKLGVDTGACATGVLLYTVSTNTPTGSGPMRVIDTNPKGKGCAGEELNGAPLSLSGVSSFSVPGWGVKVTVTGQNGDAYNVTFDVSKT